MTPPITHHPDDATLMSLAAGSLPEPLAAVAAAHVALCPTCRRELRGMEALGAALVQRLPASSGAAMRVPSLDMAPMADRAADQRIADDNAALPAPIARVYGLALDSVPWRWLGPGVRHHPLRLSPGVAGDMRLLKIAAGRRMPVHSHGGTELTLVLAGAYSDATGVYRRGDIQDVDDDVEHRPIADADAGCICLVASERPARFKGLVGRLLQPWTGM